MTADHLPGSRSHTPVDHAAATTVAQEAGGARSSAALQVGTIYNGLISQAFGDQGIYHVELTNPKVHLPNCRLAIGVVCQLLGIQDTTMLPRGTRVEVLYGSTSFITGCEGAPLSSGFPKYPLDKEHVSPNPQSAIDGGSSAPKGMLEGERDMTNVLGVGVQLLTSLARLKAGEKAAVETFLQDSMVRVLCENFQHFSAFGEHRIHTRNGRIDVEWKGTGYDHESWGQTEENAPKVEFTEPFNAEQAADEGRWRFRAYLGHLGDFLNLIVQDPAAALGSMAQQAAGKCRLHIGQDGTFLAQSVSDLVLETVYAIPLPVQIADLESKEEAEKVASLMDVEHLKICNALAQAREDMPALAYHLREYSRWLSQAHSWQRFLQRDTAFTFESEQESMTRQAPSSDCGETDKKKAGAGAVVPKTYATVRVFRDGSILLYEGLGSAVTLSKGSVRVSARVDVSLEAARDMYFRAGGNIFMLAQRNVEITAFTGSLVTVARTAWRALCTWGSVHLRTDRDEDNIKQQADQPNGDSDPQVEAGELQPGIFLESLKSRTSIGAASATIHTKEKGLELHGKGSLWVTGFKNISAVVTEEIRMRAKALHFVGSFMNISFADFLNLGQRLIISKNGLFAKASLFVNSLIARGAIEGPPIGPQPPPTPSPIGVGPHLNHIKENTRSPADQEPGVNSQDMVALPPLRPDKPFRPESHPWRMMPAAEHSRDLRIQSVPQADIESDASADFLPASPEDMALDIPRMGDNRVPFLGPAARQHWHLESELPSMNVPCAVPAPQLNAAAQGRMRVTAATFFYRKK